MEKASGGQDDVWRHLCIQPQCGACLEPFQHQDELISLFRSGDTIEIHEACQYTWMGCCEQTNARHATFCKTPLCERCRKEEESATVHRDCVQLFVRECDAPDKYFRLWRASVAMRPWRGCVVKVPRKKGLRDLDIALDRQDLAMIRTLIPELRHMVMEAIGGSARVWRYTAVVERAKSLSVHKNTRQLVFDSTDSLSRTGDLLTANGTGDRRAVVQLDRVLSWRRESGQLRLCKSRNLSIIRITMDAFGIAEIERLDSSQSTTNPGVSGHEVYIVEHPANLSLIEAVFDAGYCRLEFPEPRHLTLLNASVTPDASWPIQSIPSPPPHLGQHNDQLAPIQQFGHLQLASTNHAWGITIFFQSGYPVALHAHTRSAPTAVETFRRIPQSGQHSCVWLYFSLSEQDEVLSLSTQFIDDGEGDSSNGSSQPRPCRLLIRTKMQGDIKLGQHKASPFSMVTRETCRRPLLICNQYPLGMSVYSAHQIRMSRIDDISSEEADPLISDGYLTEASLENVATANVFTMRNSQLCTGILLQYKNGTSRCLGQYRLGVDQVVASVENPTHLYYATATKTYPLPIGKYKGIVVEFGTSPQRTPSNDMSSGCKADWISQTLSGFAEFWMTHRSSAMRFRQA
ncbi:hypothetical protein VHEMI08172 [[Torrubiella] hemipterigena]|uniref:Uncharacterized protein n=1 Tax=[Torrubiella] hemipterigena TaxID=1531966 RepID=A0A0A1TMY6_9HYPO|nr:hypothetical protein VHEMI08172 [[Torrubiella] hemipterigena]